jgi:hypothetical protein
MHEQGEHDAEIPAGDAGGNRQYEAEKAHGLFHPSLSAHARPADVWSRAATGATGSGLIIGFHSLLNKAAPEYRPAPDCH